MSGKKTWPLMWRLRLAACVCGGIYLPAAIGTLQLCFGMDPGGLVRQKWLMALMMIPVLTRVFVVLPVLFTLLCVCTMVLEIIKAALEDKLEWPATLTALAVVICCVGMVSLEVFFQAAMGI